ncbi:MAG TPA: polysaccharide deacetylase family protein [Gemmatimonadaceae bacterium]|nr:polysaccharide deacetylase family protein [Gemmatimonadaceae bacterium]
MIRMRLPLLSAVAVLTLGATATSHHASRAASAPAADSLRVPILVYHSVMPHHPGQTAEQRVLSVDDSVFVAQMRYLVDGGYHVVSFAALVDAIEGRDTLPNRAVVITFDDGWENQYRHAFPILQRFGLTATFFVFTTPIGKDGKLMSWEQLRELQDAGMTIGSHTRTHPVLPDCHAALHNEVAMSREDIKQHLGRAPDFFAYPFGAWDAESAAWARTAGYRAARSYRGGAWNALSDLYHLRAVPVTENMRAFERALSGDGPGVVAQRGR